MSIKFFRIYNPLILELLSSFLQRGSNGTCDRHAVVLERCSMMSVCVCVGVCVCVCGCGCSRGFTVVMFFAVKVVSIDTPPPPPCKLINLSYK